MHRLRGKLTYSNVISTLSLVLIVGGGTAFAASEMLPKGSVGTKQIQKEAVTPSKLSKKAKATLTGPQGPQGAQGPAGPAGREGAAGKNLTATTPLASGATETGVFAAGAGGPGSAAGQLTAVNINFVQPLSAPLDVSHGIVLNSGESSASHCPGVGKADPGYLCVYVGYELNANIYTPVEDPQTGSAGTGKAGAIAYAHTAATGIGAVSGTWAVTAP
jgi:hypothetical protein